MPSEIAQTIVNHIFSDEKAKAIDATNDALAAQAYDRIQATKIEFAKEWGFDPDDTGQAVADEIADKVFDGQEPPELAPTAGELAKQEAEQEVEQPEASAETPVEDQVEPEEPTDETDS